METWAIMPAAPDTSAENCLNGSAIPPAPTRHMKPIPSAGESANAFIKTKPGCGNAVIATSATAATRKNTICEVNISCQVLAGYTQMELERTTAVSGTGPILTIL